MRDQLFKVLTLRFRYGIDLFVRVDPPREKHHRKQFAGNRLNTVAELITLPELFVPGFPTQTHADPRIRISCSSVSAGFRFRYPFGGNVQCFSDVELAESPSGPEIPGNV